MQQLLKHSWVQQLSAIYCSEEQKAIDGAEILAANCSMPYTKVTALGENDRSSTGFLAPDEFELTADQFFAWPDQSIRGWETAKAAQSRIVAAVVGIVRTDLTGGAIAIVSHGAVGTLLYCYLTKKQIDRRWDQPGSGGGNYLRISIQRDELDSDAYEGNSSAREFGSSVTCSWWEPID